MSLNYLTLPVTKSAYTCFSNPSGNSPSGKYLASNLVLFGQLHTVTWQCIGSVIYSLSDITQIWSRAFTPWSHHPVTKTKPTKMTIWLSQGLKVTSQGSIVSTFAAAIVSSNIKLPTGSDLRRLSLVWMPSKPKAKASCRLMGGRN